MFDFPEGIGPLECVNVEHEEVVLVPRWVDCNRVTFKYGLGEEFIDVLEDAAQARPRPARSRSRSRGVEVSPRDVVAACLPNPAELGDRMRGKTCAGTSSPAPARTARRARVYLYHVVDNEQAMREYGHQAVVLQTAFNPVVALELLDAGVWPGTGVLGPEAFPPRRSSTCSADYGSPTGISER